METKNTVNMQDEKHPLFEGGATNFNEAATETNSRKAAEINATKEFYAPVADEVQEVEEVKESDASAGPLFNQTTAIEKPANNNGLMSVDLMGGDLPDLDDMEVIPLDLVGNYWTPEMPGESKRAYFDGLLMSQFKQPEEEDVVIELETAYFYAKQNGAMVKFCNASKRLVAALKQAHIERGTPILITFMGKKKNSTNQFKSDVWSVKPLQIKIK